MSALSTGGVVLAGLLLVVSAPGLLRQFSGGWTIHSTFFLVLFLAPIAAIIIAAITQAKFQSHDEFGAPVLISVENRSIADFARLTAMVIGLGILLSALLRRRKLLLPSVALCVGATLLTYLSNLLHFDDPADLILLGMIAVYAGVAVPIDRRAAAHGVTAGLVVLMASCVFVGLVSPSIASLPCNLGKCGFTGELFIGSMDSENQLAITLAMALPFALLGLHGLARSSVAAACAVLIVLSGSRSSQIALVGLLVLWLVARGERPAARVLLGVVTAAMALVALLLPLAVRNPDAFTGRGGLWQLALKMVGSSPWIGLGQDAWGAQAAVGNVGSNAGYSPHNLWLDALVAGGWISTGLVVVAILLRFRGLRERSVWLTLPLAVAMLEGFTERSFAYYDLSSTTAYFLPALIAVGGGASYGPASRAMRKTAEATGPGVTVPGDIAGRGPGAEVVAGRDTR